MREVIFMGPMVFWIGSIIETFIFNYLNSKRVYKDLADRGYKVKFTGYNELYMEETPLVERFIPFFNILGIACNIQKYNDTVDEMVRNLNRIGFLLPMTKEEKELYQLNPTSRNAFKIAMNDFLYRKYGNGIIYESVLGTSTIIYGYDFEAQEVEIVNCTGPLSSLNKEELLEFVNLILECCFIPYYEKYGSDFEYYRAILEGRETPIFLKVREQDLNLAGILKKEEAQAKLEKKL